jgi:hypothetical protein
MYIIAKVRPLMSDEQYISMRKIVLFELRFFAGTDTKTANEPRDSA